MPRLCCPSAAAGREAMQPLQKRAIAGRPARSSTGKRVAMTSSNKKIYEVAAPSRIRLGLGLGESRVRAGLKWS